jgi:hypothetical protein
MVIAECGYVIERELASDAESLIYQSIVDRTLLIEELTARDWERI